MSSRRQLTTSRPLLMGMRLFRPHRTLLIALAAVLALVAPIAPAAAAPGDPIEAAATLVEPAVVRIDTRVDYQGVVGVGTGFVLDPNGQVLTNFHVVQGADRITGTVGGRPFAAQLVGYDRGRDIAVLPLSRRVEDRRGGRYEP